MLRRLPGALQAAPAPHAAPGPGGVDLRPLGSVPALLLRGGVPPPRGGLPGGLAFPRVRARLPDDPGLRAQLLRPRPRGGVDHGLLRVRPAHHHGGGRRGAARGAADPRARPRGPRAVHGHGPRGEAPRAPAGGVDSAPWKPPRSPSSRSSSTRPSPAGPTTTARAC